MIMMIFASFMAGATAEGGGAVAFPIMTLFFAITPEVSRDFSLLIQSFGMSFAAIFIYLNNIKVLGNIIKIAIAFGVSGLFIGFYFVEGKVPASFLKMFFTCFWLTFAITIIKFRVKIIHQTIDSIQTTFKNVLLIAIFSLIGGIITSQLGSGIDIIIFSLLTILFGINIKIAIPTSVIIMALTSIMSTICKSSLHLPTSSLAYDYFKVAIPIVILGAPLGSWFTNKFSSSSSFVLLNLSIIAQFISALVIIDQSSSLMMFNFASLAFGFLFFGLMHILRGNMLR